MNIKSVQSGGLWGGGPGVIRDYNPSSSGASPDLSPAAAAAAPEGLSHFLWWAGPSGRRLEGPGNSWEEEEKMAGQPGDLQSRVRPLGGGRGQTSYFWSLNRKKVSDGGSRFIQHWSEQTQRLGDSNERSGEGFCSFIVFKSQES